MKARGKSARQEQASKLMFEPGCLLVADPTRAHPHDENAVILITESDQKKTAGIRLNLPDDRPFENIVRPEYIDSFPDKNVFLGGQVNPGALVMFHSNEWFSRNTMPLNEKWSISSDEFMLEKIAMGNAPSYFKMCLGFTVVSTLQVTQTIISKTPSWMILEDPSELVLTCDHLKMYDFAIAELSSRKMSCYL